MGHFRWIDARKGILEIVNGEPKVIFFGGMTTSVKLGHGFFSSKVRVAIYNDNGVFRYKGNDDVELRLVAEEDDAQLLEHYQSWLARVMLAEDIHKSRAEERKGDGKAVRRSTEGNHGVGSHDGRAEQVVDERSSETGDDHNSGRVPLPSEGRNFPVVPRERLWRIRKE